MLSAIIVLSEYLLPLPVIDCRPSLDQMDLINQSFLNQIIVVRGDSIMQYKHPHP